MRIPATDLKPDLVDITTPVHLRRRGVEAKLVVGTAQLEPDPVLLRTLADAHRWAAALRDGTPLGLVARSAGKDEAFVRKRIRLAFLAPKIQRTIVEGSPPLELTLRQILPLRIPHDWEVQKRLFGLRIPADLGDKPAPSELQCRRNA